MLARIKVHTMLTQSDELSLEDRVVGQPSEASQCEGDGVIAHP